MESKTFHDYNYTDFNQTSKCRLVNVDIWFSILGAIFVLVTIPGVIGNAILLFLLPKAHLLHKNVRYFMFNMTLAALFICIWCAGKGVYQLLLASGVVHLSKPMSPVTCTLMEMGATTAAFMLLLSIFVMGAERLYATWKRETTDNASEWLSKIIIGLWAVAALHTFIQVVTSDSLPRLCICHSILAFHPHTLLVTCTIYFCIEVPSVIIYFIIRWWNRVRLFSFGVNAATHSLSERFQIWNTLRATEMLLVSVCTHGLCWSVVELGSYPALLFYQQRSFGLDVDVPSLNILHVVMSFMVFHAALHPFVSISCSEHLRKTLKRQLEAMHFRSAPLPANHATCASTAHTVGHKMHSLNPAVVEGGTNGGVFETAPNAAIQLEERPRTRIAAKAGQRMGIPTRQVPVPTAGPAYQVYQITPEQSAALLQRFWT